MACNQLCIFAAVCDWLVQHIAREDVHNHEDPVLAANDYTTLTLRHDSTVWEDPLRDIQEESKSIVHVSQQAGFTAESTHRTSAKDSKGYILVCREYSSLRNEYDSGLVCVLKDNVRIGHVLKAKTSHWPDYIVLMKSWYPEKWSKIVAGYQSAEA